MLNYTCKRCYRPLRIVESTTPWGKHFLCVPCKRVYVVEFAHATLCNDPIGHLHEPPPWLWSPPPLLNRVQPGPHSRGLL